MEEKKKFEEMESQLLGDKVLRIRHRKPRKRLRLAPNIPGVFRFLGDVVTKTPLIPLLIILFVLWLLGLLYAIQGEKKPVPILGEYFDEKITFIN